MGLSQNPIVARAQVVATRAKKGLGRMLSREPLPELITPEGVRIGTEPEQDNGFSFDKTGENNGNTGGGVNNTYRNIITSKDYKPALKFGSEQEYQQYYQEMNLEGAPQTLAEYENLRYTDPKEYYLVNGYVSAVEKQDISVLIGYQEYKNVSQQVERLLVGQTTQDGMEIKGYKSHFLDRVIGQQAANDVPHTGMRKGVEISDVLDTLMHPVSISQIMVNKNGLRYIVYKGRNCVVRVNPDTSILIQCNPR